VVDDDPSIRGALESLFEAVGMAVRTYGSAREFLESGEFHGSGCIVIDVRLPDVDGLELQLKLSEMDIRLPVVVMTGHGDIPMSVQAMKHGAVDFLVKPFRDQDLLEAVSAAVERDRRRREIDSSDDELEQRFARLSSREREVMLLVTAGKLNKQAAGDLGISEITVKVHRGAAMRKMGARTLPELVRMADRVRQNRCGEAH
jgi:FixJ family two-component response regulator